MGEGAGTMGEGAGTRGGGRLSTIGEGAGSMGQGAGIHGGGEAGTTGGGRLAPEGYIGVSASWARSCLLPISQWMSLQAAGDSWGPAPALLGPSLGPSPRQCRSRDKQQACNQSELFFKVTLRAMSVAVEAVYLQSGIMIHLLMIARRH